MNKIFFHIDMDAFFASVEQVKNPLLKGKPVIIGATDPKRGVVSACSYEARKYGIHSAMSAYTAHKLCPDGLFLPVNFSLYKKISNQVMDIFNNYSPIVQQLSIDEANLDMSGTTKLYGSIESVAEQIKNDVLNQTGPTISIGVGPNKYISKMASDYFKPNGLCIIKQGEEAAFIQKHNLSKIWGLGKSTLAKLNKNNIKTINDLVKIDELRLSHIVGNAASKYLYKAVRGIDPGIYSNDIKSHSISNEHTYKFDTNDKTIIGNTIMEISLFLMYKLFENRLHTNKITLKLRYSNFETFTISKTYDKNIETASELHRLSISLLKQKWDPVKRIRLIGLSLNDVNSLNRPSQNSLFESENNTKQKDVENAIFKMKKNGINISKASLLKK